MGSAGRLHGFGEGVGEADPVKRLDAVGQADGGGGLVGLQPADKVQFCARMCCEQRREFLLRFLYAVFAEDDLAGRNCLGDGGSRMGFGNGDERDLIRIAAGAQGRGGDTFANAAQALGDG